MPESRCIPKRRSTKNYPRLRAPNNWRIKALGAFRCTRTHANPSHLTRQEAGMNNGDDRSNLVANWSRRRLLSAGLVGFGGLHLPTLLEAAEKKSPAGPAKHVIFLH